MNLDYWKPFSRLTGVLFGKPGAEFARKPSRIFFIFIFRRNFYKRQIVSGCRKGFWKVFEQIILKYYFLNGSQTTTATILISREKIKHQGG